MREVKYTTRFRRDYKREKSGRHGRKLDALLMEVVNMLAADQPLPPRNVDHSLQGEWKDFRDCHVRPDLILIYRKPDVSATTASKASASTLSVLVIISSRSWFNWLWRSFSGKELWIDHRNNSLVAAVKKRPGRCKYQPHQNVWV